MQCRITNIKPPRRPFDVELHNRYHDLIGMYGILADRNAIEDIELLNYLTPCLGVKRMTYTQLVDFVHKLSVLEQHPRFQPVEELVYPSDPWD